MKIGAHREFFWIFKTKLLDANNSNQAPETGWNIESRNRFAQTDMKTNGANGTSNQFVTFDRTPQQT